MSGAWDGRPRVLAVRPQSRSPLSQLKSHLQLAPLHRNPIGNRSLNPRPQIPQRQGAAREGSGVAHRT